MSVIEDTLRRRGLAQPEHPGERRLDRSDARYPYLHNSNRSLCSTNRLLMEREGQFASS